MSRFGGERVYSKEDARGEIIIRNKPAIIRKVKKIWFQPGSYGRSGTEVSTIGRLFAKFSENTSKPYSLVFR